MLRDLAGELRCDPARIPPVFRAWPPRPVKIGAFEDLIGAFPSADVAKLSRWLVLWTRCHPYLEQFAKGGARRDLAGQPAGMITDDQRKYALKILKSNRITTPAPAPSAGGIRELAPRPAPHPSPSFQPPRHGQHRS